MTSYFDKGFFRGNRQRLRSVFSGSAPIVLSANGLIQKSADSAYAFVQESNFWYLTGIDDPDVVLVMDKNKEYLIVRGAGKSRMIFEQETDLEKLAEVSGIETIYDAKKGWYTLGKKLKKAKHVAVMVPPPARIDSLDMYTNPARQFLLERIKAENNEIVPIDLRPFLAQIRMIKQKPELLAIQASIDLTAKTLNTIKRGLPKFKYEYEIEAHLTRSFRKKNAQHGFDPIVAGGKNATTIHYTKNSDPLDPAQAVVLDVGAMVDHYSADITRTFGPSKPTKRQQAVYSAVLAVQDYAFELIKPGVAMKDYEQAIEKYMGEKLRELGLIRTIDTESVRQFYPHGTSHHLGLDVHDMADYALPFSAGMVLTVEPGIYIPSEGIGVRIEDDVLVTKKGIKILSSGLSRDF